MHYLKTSSMQIFDFSKLHTAIPPDNLKTRLKGNIHNAFYFKKINGKLHCKLYFSVRNYRYLILSNTKQNAKWWCTENIVISMLEFLIEHIFV